MADKDWGKELALVLEGKKSLRELLEIDSERMGLLTELAYLHFKEGRYEEARELFEGLLATEPGNVYLCRALGATLQRLGDFDLAMRYFQRALKINENEPEVWANMGEILLQQNQRDQAINHLEKAENLYRSHSPSATQRQRVRALLKQLKRMAV